MAESALTLAFDKFEEAVAYQLGYSRTDSNWSAAEAAEVSDLVQQGLRQFYFPPPIQEGSASHRWSFLYPEATLSLVNTDYDYDLPADFEGGISAFTFSSADGERIVPVIDITQILSMRSMNTQTGTPNYAAIRPKAFAPTTGHLHEVIFYPTPNASLTARYHYLVSTAEIDDTNQYPMGGAAHSETILQSCLAVAERRIEEEVGVQHQKFMELLAASIAHDKSNFPESRQTWPVGQSLPTDGSLVYDDYVRETGKALGYGWDNALWSFDMQKHIDSVVQRGLRQYYDGGGHQWSFLRETATITLADGDFDYDLPADFVGMVGDFNY